MPATIKILLAVDIFDQSNPPDCDMHAPFGLPRAARGSPSRAYRTPPLVRSQMSAPLVCRAVLAARIEVPQATVPKTTATHGPGPRRERGGGDNTARRRG